MKWWPNYGYTGRTVFGICALLKPVTAVQRVGSSENLRKTALQGGFFVFRARDYDATDRISRRSSVIFDRYGIKDCNARSI